MRIRTASAILALLLAASMTTAALAQSAAQTDDDGASADGRSFVARRVHQLPAREAAAHATHLVGTIATAATANGTTTLSIKLADGSSQSVTVSAATRIRPEGKSVADLTVGTKVTVVSKDGAATGVVVMPAA